MNLKIRQSLTIARLTAMEVARQPICILLLTTCILMMLISAMQAYQFGEDGKLARDGALALHFVFGLLVGSYAACTALTREMKSGTASAILSKPVSREAFFIAKYLGVASIVVLFSACAIPATLLAEKAAPKLYVMDWTAAGFAVGSILLAYVLGGAANFFFKKSFASTAFWLMLIFMITSLVIVSVWDDPRTSLRVVKNHVMHVDTAIQWRIIPAGILITMALLALSALSVVLAIKLQTLAAVVALFVILIVGLISDYLFSSVALVQRLVPDWQGFWMAEALSGGNSIPASYLLMAGLYSLACIGAILGIGLLLFRNREIT